MKLIKRMLSIGLIMTFLLSCTFTSQASSFWPSEPGITSDAGIIMNADTGTVLYSKNIDTQMYPASITKLMTVLLVLENTKLDEVVTFSKAAVYNIEFGSNHIGGTVGEQMTIEQCLYGILLESANEVCNAVGEHISGSYDAFIELMNKRAAELGCSNTHFCNPNGLHNKEHYSSAYDMALIARECLKYDDFRRIAGSKKYQMDPTNNTAEIRYLYNQHKMFPGRKYEYDGFECGKTGFTDQALNTLVTVAKRGDLELIVVTMHGNNTHYTDTATLLDFGFDNYTNLRIADADSTIKDESILKKDSTISDFIGDSTEYTFTCDPNALLTLPNGASISDVVQKISDIKVDGNTLTGKISYSQGNDIMGAASFTITKPEKKEAASVISEAASDLPLFIKILIGVGIFLAILLVLYIILLIYAKARRKRRRRKRRNQRRN